jgi:hypothetical protein
VNMLGHYLQHALHLAVDSQSAGYI